MQPGRLTRRHGKVFWRYFVSMAALCLAAIVVLTWLAANAYEGLLWRHVREELRAAAVTTAEMLDVRWPEMAPGELQPLIRAAGEAIEIRLTLVNMAGQVLADSHLPNAEALSEMEQHGNRQEIVAALHHGEGAAQRRSPTLGERYLYHAVRIEDAGEPVGVVRAALPTGPITAEIVGVRRWLYVVAATLATAGAAIAYLLAWRQSERVRELADAALALAAGQYGQRSAVAATSDAQSDEVAAIAAALNDVGRLLARSEGQLRSTSQTQSTILEGMTEGVIAVDRGERILFANAAAGRYLGFSPAQVNGRTLLEAVRSHELRSVTQQALRSGKLEKSELTWRAKPSKVFDVLATPLPGAPPAGVVLVLRDISEIKRLEQMRQQFIANVSHELKTPLSSIRAYTETLLGGAKTDPVHCERFLQRIDEQANRLQELIFDMLSLARIESYQAPLELVDLSLTRIIERCVADFETQAVAKEIKLRRAVDGDIQVHADEEAVRQILSNLIDNALKYTPAGGTVIVRARGEAEGGVIDVEDDGPGISAEHHDRLFERFYRVDKARSRELGGTGLGLSIVKHLAHTMGGSVSLVSQVGSGSTFTVRLPAAKALREAG